MKLQELLDVIVSIQFSLLKKESAIRDNKATYLKKKSVKFVIPADFPRDEESFKWICNDMYKDLLDDFEKLKADYVGVWIEYAIDSVPITIDNAMALDSLNAIARYFPDKNLNIGYEFFKMTLPRTDENQL